MNKKIGILLSVITIVMLMFTINNVFATSPEINNILTNSSNNEFTQIQQGNISNNTANTTGTTVNNTVVNKNSVVNNAASANNTLGNKTLPQTGIDSSLTIMIVVCGASIIYAYTKIRKSDI